VPRSAAMAMVGHQTESIYRRYAIVDEAMLKDDAALLEEFQQAERAAADTRAAGKRRKGPVAGQSAQKMTATRAGCQPRTSQFSLGNWCRGRGSNPHAPCGTQDFKFHKRGRADGTQAFSCDKCDSSSHDEDPESCISRTPSQVFRASRGQVAPHQTVARPGLRRGVSQKPA